MSTSMGNGDTGTAVTLKYKQPQLISNVFEISTSISKVPKPKAVDLKMRQTAEDTQE